MAGTLNNLSYLLLLLVSLVSLAVNGQLVNNVEMLGDIDEFSEGDFSVQILVGLDNGSVDQLLQLHIVEVIADHHLEYREQLSIRDVAVIVDVVDLESKSKLLLLGGGGGQTVETLYEFEEGNASILVFVQDGDYSLDKGVLCQFYKNRCY